MKTIKKIKGLTAKGQLLPAITLAIQSTKESSPLKDNFYQQGKLLKQLQKDYKNQLIEEFQYTNELNEIISNFLGGVNTLASNPDQVQRNYIYKRWWFWPLLLLGSFIAYKYFTKSPPPPPPEQEMTLAFSNNQYILSGTDEEPEYFNTIEKINKLHQKKLQLQSLLGETPPPPIIQFRETKTILGNTINQIENSYQQEIINLEMDLINRYESTTIQFESNSTEIKDSDLASIEELSTILKQTNLNLHILGFMDTVGSKKQNASLSCKRTEAVQNKLSQFYSKNGNDWSTRIKVYCGDQQQASSRNDLQQGRIVKLALFKNIETKLVSK